MSRGTRGIGAAVLGLALAMSAAAAAQTPPSSPPDWLAQPPASRAETPHLVAVAAPVASAPDARGRVTLTLRVAPRPGMRIYAHDATGYVPFTLDLEPTTGITVADPTYPTSTLYVFPPTGERSRVYGAPIAVEQTVTLSPALSRRWKAGEIPPLVGTLRYQACDDKLCYRPTQVRLAWTPGADDPSTRPNRHPGRH